MMGVRIADSNFTALQRVPSEDCSKESAFACTVRSKDRRAASANDVGGNVAQRGFAAVTDGDVAKSKDAVSGVEHEVRQ